MNECEAFNNKKKEKIKIEKRKSENNTSYRENVCAQFNAPISLNYTYIKSYISRYMQSAPFDVNSVIHILHGERKI